MKLFDICLALFCTLIWAGSFVSGKIAVSYLTPLLFVALRSIITAVIIFPFANTPTPPFKIIALVSLSNLMMHAGLFIAFWLEADVAISIILTQLSVPFSVILASVYCKEDVSFQKIIGISITFIGVMLAVGKITITSFIPLIFVLISAIGLAWFSLLLKLSSNFNVSSLISYSSLCSFAILTIATYLLESPDLRMIKSAPLDVIFALLYLSIIGVVAWFLWVYLLGKYPLSTMAPFQLLVPIFGLLMSAIIFKSHFTNNLILGSLVVFIGQVILVYRSRESNEVQN